MSHRRLGILGLLAAAGFASTAASQLTLPPPPPRPTQQYVPRTEQVEANRQAQAQAQAEANAQAQNKFDPTTVEFEPIWTMGDDGIPVEPDEYIDIAALRNNPLVDKEMWPFIEALLEERAQEMEIIAHNYPRYCIDAVTSVIPNFDVRDESTRVPLGDITLALNAPISMTSWLAEQGVLSDEMSTMNQHISMDFTQTSMMSIQNALPEGTDQMVIINHQSRFLVRLGIGEQLNAFGRLSRRIVENNPDLVENPSELLALEGSEFIDAVAEALAPQNDEALTKLFAEALR